jgi:hypothetical protein
MIDFSGDGGNVVTEIEWASWTETEASGYGTSERKQPPLGHYRPADSHARQSAFTSSIWRGV